MKLFTLILLLIASSRTAAATTVLPLGDSITAGYNGLTDFDTGYRGDLLADLNAQSRQIQYVGTYDPTTYTGAGYDVAGFSPALTATGQNYCAGYSGYSSLTILQNLDGNVPSPLASVPGVLPNMGGDWITGNAQHAAIDPNIVLLVTGTNDSFQGIALGEPWTPGTSEGDIAGILRWFAINRPGTDVVLACPPLTTSQPTSNALIAGLEQWEPGYIAANFPQDQFVDLVTAVPLADINTADGVHPTDAGYADIASAFDGAIVGRVSSVPEPMQFAWALILLAVTSRRLRDPAQSRDDRRVTQITAAQA